MSKLNWTLTRLVVLLAAFALVATACSGSSTTTISDVASDSDSDSVETAEQEPEPTAVPEPTAEPEPTAAPEPTATPEPEPTATPVPQIFWGSELEVGVCINRLEGNPPFEPPDIISCDDFHEEEIYAAGQLDFPPGAPYPGSDEVADMVSAELCDQATIDFAGEPWDRLPFVTFLLYPLEEEWDAGDRNIFCSAGPDEGVAFKIGTAAGGTIDSDDVLIARSSLTSDGVDFEDWAVITEYATIDTMGSLTDGQFDVPLRRPSVTSVGLVFAAHEGGPGEANSVWGYAWDTKEFTDFGTFSDGSEFGTVLFSEDGATVISAKDPSAGDWDLWITDGDSDFVPLVANVGDQRYPTFTPDFSQVVYHDEGDLWIINIDGTDPRQLTDSDANDWESVVSPDGSTIVFASDRSGNDDLWAISIDGGTPVNLTNHPADDVWPVFSEDGSLIYFGSDRLDPVDDRPKVMVMEADGSNQSWFAAVGSSHAVVLPADIGAEVLATAPTLDERYNYNLVAGEPGEVTLFEHSSGRLTAELPAGWRVGEVNEQIGFLAAPQPSRYFDTWNTDGVMVLLYEDISREAFFALYDETDAVSLCEQFDGTGEIVPLDETTDFLSGNFNCGPDGAVGGVLAFYNIETGVGVIMEGQRDNLPDADLDSETITAIARSVTWG